MDKKYEKTNFFDKSEHLKIMIMNKHDISDERHEEIKMKFKKHMKFEMTDERKILIHDRLVEMNVFEVEP